MVVDVVGSSRLIQLDERGTLAAIDALQKEIIAPLARRHCGRVVKTTGDGAILEFASPVGAVECAVDVQEAVQERWGGMPRMAAYGCASASTWVTSSRRRMTCTATASTSPRVLRASPARMACGSRARCSMSFKGSWRSRSRILASSSSRTYRAAFEFMAGPETGRLRTRKSVCPSICRTAHPLRCCRSPT